LIDNGINGDSGLPDTTVAQYQLALAAPDRYHRVDSFNTCLQRLVNRLAFDHVRSARLYVVIDIGLYRAFAVQRITQRVDYTAQQGFAYRYLKYTPGTMGFVALFDAGIVTQYDKANHRFLEIKNDPVSIAGQSYHLGV